jgi:hypothetical protein
MSACGGGLTADLPNYLTTKQVLGQSNQVRNLNRHSAAPSSLLRQIQRRVLEDLSNGEQHPARLRLFSGAGSDTSL